MRNALRSRETFLCYGEIVEMAVDHCHQIARALAIIGGIAHDKRTRLLLQPLGEHQRQLAGIFEAHLDHAPRALLETRCQSVPDIDLNAGPRRLQGKSLPEIGAQVLKWNDGLAQMFYGLAEATDIPRLAEKSSMLGDAVLAKARQMSRTLGDSGGV